MRKVYFIIILIGVFRLDLSAQTGINTLSPHTSALLDIHANDRGVLLPKYILTDLNSTSTPVVDPDKGAMIYNEGGSHPKGYYYWDGMKWNRLIVNREMVQILSVAMRAREQKEGTAQEPLTIIPSGTSVNYVDFGNDHTTYLNTLGVSNPTGKDITLPAGTYKVNVAFDCAAKKSPNTGTLSSNMHLFVVEAAIVDSSDQLLTDLKTASDVADGGVTSVQSYTFTFVLKLESEQTVKLLLKNGSGATSNAPKESSHSGLVVNFYKMF